MAICGSPRSIPTLDDHGGAGWPDGALWFVEASGNKIGQVTNGGNISEVAIPTSNSVPFGIVTDSDGHLWFTDFSANKIGELSIHV
jgi:virginiamycin B lyase